MDATPAPHPVPLDAELRAPTPAAPTLVDLARLAGLALLLTAIRTLRKGIHRLRRRLATAAQPSAQTGQATAEYALVLLGAAVVAIALVTWATGSGRVGDLFDRVFDELVSRL
jgi:hypothetical protein